MATELKKTFERKSLNPNLPYMPKEEWESRIKKARGLMERDGLDALFILNNVNRLYFFGCPRPGPIVFPNIGIIPKKGPTTLIAGSEDADIVDVEGYTERNIGFREDVRAPTDTAPDPITLMVEVIKELDLANKTIGMEFGPFMWWEGFVQNEWERFKKELFEAKFVDATGLIWEIRMIKSYWEIEVMKRLYYATCKAFFEIINNARPGVNEKDLFYDALRVLMDEGVVESGYNWHPGLVNMVFPMRDRIMKEGDWLLLDGGTQYKGYMSDIQRMIHIGDPGRQAMRAASFAYDGQRAVEEILKPGVTAGEIWMTAISKVAEGDQDMWRKVRSRRFPSWVGHGEGLNLHEPPYLVEGSDEAMREGMVIAVEIPSFYVKKLMNMPEDAYLITKEGFEKLSIDLGPGDIYVKT